MAYGIQTPERKNLDGLAPAKPTDDDMIAMNAARWQGDGTVKNDALNKAFRFVRESISDLAKRRKDPIAAFVLGARLARGEHLPV